MTWIHFTNMNVQKWQKINVVHNYDSLITVTVDAYIYGTCSRGAHSMCPFRTIQPPLQPLFSWQVVTISFDTYNIDIFFFLGIRRRSLTGLHNFLLSLVGFLQRPFFINRTIWNSLLQRLFLRFVYFHNFSLTVFFR